MQFFFLFCRPIRLTQLILYGFQLFTEVIFTLGLSHFDLNLILDTTARLRYLQLTVEKNCKSFQPLANVIQFQNGLLICQWNFQVKRNEVS